MTVKELIQELQEFPLDAIILQSRDSDISLGRYDAQTTWYGYFKLDKLTPELKRKGYGEEDVGIGPIAVCFWPTN